MRLGVCQGCRLPDEKGGGRKWKTGRRPIRLFPRQWSDIIGNRYSRTSFIGSSSPTFRLFIHSTLIVNWKIALTRQLINKLHVQDLNDRESLMNLRDALTWNQEARRFFGILWPTTQASPILKQRIPKNPWESLGIFENPYPGIENLQDSLRFYDPWTENLQESLKILDPVTENLQESWRIFDQESRILEILWDSSTWSGWLN